MTVARSRRDAGGGHFRISKALLAQVTDERIPTVRRTAEAEARHGFRRQPATLEIGSGSVPLRAFQGRVEKAGGGTIDFQNPAAQPAGRVVLSILGQG